MCDSRPGLDHVEVQIIRCASDLLACALVDVLPRVVDRVGQRQACSDEPFSRYAVQDLW